MGENFFSIIDPSTHEQRCSRYNKIYLRSKRYFKMQSIG